MPKVFQHLVNCNMWRDVDQVSAMPKEECSMVTGIVITAKLEMTAASVFCTLKHLKKRKVCWMMISMSCVLLRTSHFQWWRKGVRSFLTFWKGKKVAWKRVKALQKLWTCFSFVLDRAIPLQSSLSGTYYATLVIVWPLFHRKPTQWLQHGVLLKHNAVPHYHPDVQDLLQDWD